MATALTALLMVGVVEMFAAVGESVNDSRSILELSDDLRTVQTRLQMDLEGITVTMLPPRSPECNEGYAEFREGPIGPALPGTQLDAKSSRLSFNDLTVTDNDDILMFTTRSKGRPFVGRVKGNPQESDVAEVAWFVRGTTLYRRVLLVSPRFSGVVASASRPGFYRDNDLSVHFDGNRLVANTLADLTKRECRFAHWYFGNPAFQNISGGDPHSQVGWYKLGLPTLCECSSRDWRAGDALPDVSNLSENSNFDYWEDSRPYTELLPTNGALPNYTSPRVAEDVILTNVIGFDMQVWDPSAPVIVDNAQTLALGPADEGFDAVSSPTPITSYGAYVDLGYWPGYTPAPNAPEPQFHHAGIPASGLATGGERIYDTWSTHYENDGVDQVWHDYANDIDEGENEVDLGTDGFDNNGNGIVDDMNERETSPPYPVPLRGIRVKIRAFDPDSRQIREVTVVQDFLPK